VVSGLVVSHRSLFCRDILVLHLIELESWKALEAHAARMRLLTIRDLKQDLDRSSACMMKAPYVTLDFSQQCLDEAVLQGLLALGKERLLDTNIQALLNGGCVNKSEGKPALHTALRAPRDTFICVNGQDVMPSVIATRERMGLIAEQIRTGVWRGYSGLPMTDIVNIGIGGSDLGPRFCVQALASYTAKHLNYHFISDVDPLAFTDTLQYLNPETTLFIVASKSFTTPETLYNANKARLWFNHPEYIAKHFIAVTANVEKAQSWGCEEVLPIWDWIGGRYSLCSAINLITAIAIGFEAFSALLAGAYDMDKHFQDTPWRQNLPVLLALLGVWNNNFLQIHTLLLLVYTKQLEALVPYIQQLDMESNGKFLDHDGRAVHYATGPMVWGGLGNQAQHSYYQLLCQGTHAITADLIQVKALEQEMIHQIGRHHAAILSEGVWDLEDASGCIPGNMPLNQLQLSTCSPEAIGALIALYEHKIFCQSVIWNINSFDQPGVESAKRHHGRKITKHNTGISASHMP